MKLLVVAVGHKQPAWAQTAYAEFGQAVPARDAPGGCTP